MPGALGNSEQDLRCSEPTPVHLVNDRNTEARAGIQTKAASSSSGTPIIAATVTLSRRVSVRRRRRRRLGAVAGTSRSRGGAVATIDSAGSAREDGLRLVLGTLL